MTKGAKRDRIHPISF